MICQTAVPYVIQAGSPCPAWSPSFLCQQRQFLPFSSSVTFLTMLMSQLLLSICWPSTRPSIVLVNQVSCCVLWAHCNLTGFQHDTCNTLPLLSHVCLLSLRAPPKKRPYIIWLCTPNAWYWYVGITNPFHSPCALLHWHKEKASLELCNAVVLNSTEA